MRPSACPAEACRLRSCEVAAARAAAEEEAEAEEEAAAAAADADDGGAAAHGDAAEGVEDDDRVADAAADEVRSSSSVAVDAFPVGTARPPPFSGRIRCCRMRESPPIGPAPPGPHQ